MQSQQIEMPKKLEKDIQKYAKKKNLIKNYKTELSFVVENNWWIVSNWGIIVSFLPDNETARGFANARYGRWEDRSFWCSSPWDSFELEFDQNLLHITQIKEEIGFDSVNVLGKIKTKIASNSYVVFPDNGLIQLLEVMYKNYSPNK